MRVAWFTHRYAPVIGGSENYARAMVRRMVGEGHEVDVFTTDADDLARFTSPAGRAIEADSRTNIDGARITRFRPRHVPGQRYAGKLLGYAPLPSIRSQFASFFPILPGINRVRGEYDLVCSIAFPYTNFTYAALRTARAAGAPLVVTPFLHLATPGDPVHRAYTRSHQRWLLSQADLVVAATRLEADTIVSWGINRSRLLTLPMAIEHADVTGGDGLDFRARLGLDASTPLVGQLGALDLDKGTVDLVNALSRINASRVGTPVQLALAGRATPRFAEFLGTLEHSPWLHHIGPITTEECRGFFDAIDIFAMPSRTDSFGIVFLEAWANGKPVVAARAGGVAEVVQDGVNGLLVPFGQPGDLAAAIGRLVASPSLGQTLGATGKQQVETGYTWDDRYRTLTGRIETLTSVDRRTRSSRIASGSPLATNPSGSVLGS
ncbi:glycosyltransferase family 4 protein [Isosphaeraceae bacterium EP7]